MIDAQYIIKALDLQPHPAEGGYFVETYRSPVKLARPNLDKQYSSDRSLSTAIYFLLTPETFSAMHRLPTDEVFHYYLGDPVTMLHLYPDGSGRIMTLGPEISAGQRPQVVVPAGVWQGARLIDGGRFCLMGTTMAPGFDFADYTPGNESELIERYPAHEQMIHDLS